jgi:hypothetical protein
MLLFNSHVLNLVLTPFLIKTRSFFVNTTSATTPNIQIQVLLLHDLKLLFQNLELLIMISSDAIISLAIGLGGIFIAVLGTWIGYLSLKAMKFKLHLRMNLKSFCFCHLLIICSKVYYRSSYARDRICGGADTTTRHTSKGPFILAARSKNIGLTLWPLVHIEMSTESMKENASFFPVAIR